VKVWVYHIANWSRLLSGWVLVAAILLLCFDVVCRYFFPSYLPDWSAEVVTYMVVWGMFLVAGELAIDNKHIQADLVVNRLSKRAQFSFGIAGSAAGLGFSILLVNYGWDVVAFAHMIGEEGESSLRLPKYIYYFALPLGMFLQTMGYLVRLHDQIFESGRDLDDQKAISS